MYQFLQGTSTVPSSANLRLSRTSGCTFLAGMKFLQHCGYFAVLRIFAPFVDGDRMTQSWRTCCVIRIFICFQIVSSISSYFSKFFCVLKDNNLLTSTFIQNFLRLKLPKFVILLSCCDHFQRFFSFLFHLRNGEWSKSMC